MLPRGETSDGVAPEHLVEAQRVFRRYAGDGLQRRLGQRSRELRIELLKYGLDVDSHGSFLNVGSAAAFDDNYRSFECVPRDGIATAQ